MYFTEAYEPRLSDYNAAGNPLKQYCKFWRMRVHATR